MSGGVDGAKVVALARGWIGTPYLHQAASRQIGCDCLGLIRGLWRELYGAEPEAVPAYTPDWAEAGGDEKLWAAGLRHLLPCGDGVPLMPGQVLLFRMRPGAIAKHLGLASQPGRFIHAYDRCGVIETALTSGWSRRIVARFAFPAGRGL
ncbi:peptidase [Paracoccus sp. p4-l81]|uniref:peptidase n=1 Tax=unclassified Paracoccus (in: a-proteobacteria) TaxID=2688777 RepID=UPI0035B6DD86